MKAKHKFYIYSKLTSFFPGSSKHFLIKTVDKIRENWKIKCQEGSDYGGGGMDDNVGGGGGMDGPGDGWHSPPEDCVGCSCGCGGWGGGKKWQR